MANNRRGFLQGALAVLGVVCTPKLVRAALSGPSKPNRLNWEYEQWEAAFKTRGCKKAQPAMVSNIHVHRLIHNFSPKGKDCLRFVQKDLEFWSDWRAWWGLDSAPGWPKREHRQVHRDQKSLVTNPRQSKIASKRHDAYVERKDARAWETYDQRQRLARESMARRYSEITVRKVGRDRTRLGRMSASRARSLLVT